MKKMHSCLLALLILSCSALAYATDYASLSTEELSKLRGTLYNASEEERLAFRTEWQKRVQSMSQEELQKYMGPANKGQGMRGQGMGQGKGGGQGKGAGNY